ncbi:chemotaxis protein CheW [Legionella pneumophila]|nr:chemotaxis protein CheW [Legionella pneumophila]HAT1884051.1 chemotaxis protein CheW [Legionella pneumophila]HAT2115641.1 chemotaxis protein CheW [Legionella pneumophila]
MFLVDERRFGFPIEIVDRIVQIVEVTPLPNLPRMAIGIINLQGKIIPVLNIRPCFEMPERQLNLLDQLIIVTQDQKSVAYLVDQVIDVIEYSEKDFIDLELIFPGIEYVKQVLKRQDELILLLHNLDKLLPMDKAKPLQESITHANRK